MKVWVFIALLLGLAAAVALVGWFGFGAVLATLARVGWPGFAAFVATSFPLYFTLGLAWFALTSHVTWLNAWKFGVARLAREAAAELLPFSTVGGYLVGARAATVQGIAAAEAFGTGAVDLITEMLGQIAYLALGGLLILLHFSWAKTEHAGLSFAAAMAVLVVGGGGFIVAQRRGAGPLARMVARFMPAQARDLGETAAVVEATYAKPGRLAVSSLIHLCAWLLGALQAWYALGLLGHEMDLEAVIAIEALLAIARSAAFVSPGGLGVQEATYALVGPLFGIPAETGLALSLLKRARDVVIGVPALLIWQAVEGGRLFNPEPAH